MVQSVIGSVEGAATTVAIATTTLTHLRVEEGAFLHPGARTSVRVW